MIKYADSKSLRIRSHNSKIRANKKRATKKGFLVTSTLGQSSDDDNKNLFIALSAKEVVSTGRQ
jgi:hypothetical protein